MGDYLKSKSVLILAGIIILAGVLRFVGISTNPPSLTWDETAWGYNAYSLGSDGKDEFGRLLPYDYLESFGDFKPPVYAYLDILPVKVFGLTEFATRFPSASLGTLTVLITYLLVKRLFFNSKRREAYALASAFILAISPWHILLSRAAFEANVSTFFIVTGIWLFIGAVQNRQWYLPLSAISFALSLYTFNTARVVSPLIVAFLGVVFIKKLITLRKVTILSIVLGVLLVAPIIGFLHSPQASLRFREVNIFSDPKIVEQSNAEIANDHNAVWSKIIHNRRVGYADAFLKHYFDNLSLNFLFVHGDTNTKFSVQTVGEMYLWDLPFVLIGILFLIKKREGYWWLIPVWLLLAIIPAATARETPHALRTETTLPTFQILSAYGLVTLLYAITSLKRRVLVKKSLVAVIFIALIANIIFFMHTYIAHYPSESAINWQYGYKDAISYVSKVQGTYDEVWTTGELGRPYIYYLFYLKTPPQEFRKTSDIQRDSFGFVHVKSYGKYHFSDGQLDIPSILAKQTDKKILFIDMPQNIPSDARVLKQFTMPNGKPSLTAYTY